MEKIKRRPGRRAQGNLKKIRISVTVDPEIYEDFILYCSNTSAFIEKSMKNYLKKCQSTEDAQLRIMDKLSIKKGFATQSKSSGKTYNTTYNNNSIAESDYQEETISDEELAQLMQGL